MVLTPEALGISRLFDDGESTYVTFTRGVPPGLQLYDETGKSLVFSKTAEALVIPTVHSGLLLRTPTQLSFAQRSTAYANRSDPGSTAQHAAVALSQDLAQVRTELLRAQAQLSDSATWAQSPARDGLQIPVHSINERLDHISAAIDGIVTKLIRTQFATGSAVVRVPAAMQAAWITAAQESDQVQIRGRADATGTVSINIRLARARADSVRRLFTDAGIKPEKLEVSFDPVDYLAGNDTQAGRALNRRVDILFEVRNTAQKP